MALNITTKGEDDDGRQGGAEATISESDADHLRAMLVSAGRSEAQILQFLNGQAGWARIERLDDLPASRYEFARKTLEKILANRN